MVDFSRRLKTSPQRNILSPLDIYRNLDRASDKGPLRPGQDAVLSEWHLTRRNERDVILKMHTGEGKTLAGLLMLQSKLNEGSTRAAYLCPNKFLVSQSLNEAADFGIHCVAPTDSGDLPDDFLDSKAILVTSVQKLFNGKTKFGLRASSLEVDALVLDDAHACIDAIKEACEIRIDRAHAAYNELVSLFDTDLVQQGAGTWSEIRANTNPGALLSVPYWAWQERQNEVVTIAVRHADSSSFRFAWPVLKDILGGCLCVVTTRDIVISPYRPPLEVFGSYSAAKHRIFMSATLTDDSFLVKGLDITHAAVTKPLTNTTTKWSGEKMVLIPSLIHESLTQTEVVNLFGKAKKRTFGIVALVPSREASKVWSSTGARIATRDDIDEGIQQLRGGNPGDRDNPLVIVNRYDGIDLPDSACRVLILDGKPFSDHPVDRYVESCRPGSDIVASRLARRIEQGMGRAVRGEKDYCVVVLTGSSLVKSVKDRSARRFLSEQTQTQVEIGRQVAAFAVEDIEGGKKPVEVLTNIVNQCLRRDDGWKAFYEERMNAMPGGFSPAPFLGTFSAELDAERKFENGDVEGAISAIQKLLNETQSLSATDKGWYLQEMARYQFPTNKAKSNQLQVAAHNKNRYLLRPRNGIVVQRLAAVGQNRVQRVLDWIHTHEDFPSILVGLDEILSALRFGVRANDFESALDTLGQALGFATSRPDKEWKAGPDNLWELRAGLYILFECKSEVETTRAEIYRSETGQVNNSVAWFAQEYPGAVSVNVIVTPGKTLAAGAGLNQPTQLLRSNGLGRLTSNVRTFFASLRGADLKDLSEQRVQESLQMNDLHIEGLQSKYFDTVR